MPSFATGLYEMSPSAWDTELFEALLVDDAAAYVFDIDDVYVSELVSSEVTATGYARATVTPTASWDAGNGRWRLTAASLDFGAIAAGTDVAGVVVFRVETDDTDSRVWTWHPFSAPEATDGATFTVTLSSDGVARIGDA